MSRDLHHRRLAYLDAMGIQAWAARGVLTTALDENAPAEVEPAPPSLPPLQDWNVLQNEVAQCTRCELHARRTQSVLGVGKRDAQWMIIGEAPGADEDRLGEPFVGRAGQLLNLMLAAIGLARETVYITNVVKCRPPNNRDPRPDEAASCEPFLNAQIALVQPKVILAVGRIAAHHLLKTDVTVGKLRGRQFSYGELGIPVIVTYHPAYLLRSPQEKRKAWEDLLLARNVLDASNHESSINA